MRAITLWQPWATLIAIGAKQYETRHWQPSPSALGHDLIIHAAAKRDAEIMTGLIAVRPEVFQYGIKLPMPLPYGVAVCIARLVECLPTEAIPEAEQRFGDFTPGRFAWKLDRIRPFAQPVACRGAQGFWNYTGPLP